jgi:hypothetical protein
MSDQVDRDASFVIPVLILGDVMRDRHVHGQCAEDLAEGTGAGPDPRGRSPHTGDPGR